MRWEHRDVILGDSHGTDDILSDALKALILVFKLVDALIFHLKLRV